MAKKSERLSLSYPVFDVPSAILWLEPLYVFIDPSFHHYEARYIREPERFYGETAGCRKNDINCLKAYAVAALVDRLSRRAWKAPLLPSEGTPLAHYSRALSTRLEEYESGKGTLWEFYPRVFSVFAELAHPAAPVPTLAVPGKPVDSAADFFDPSWRQAFMAAP